MSITEIVNNFNCQADDLMAQMYACSQDYDIKVYHDMFKKLKLFNATKAIEQFIIFVLPYKKKIYDDDETFFLEKSGEELTGDNSEYTMMQSLKFKDLWQTLSYDSKNNIFKFFKVMVYFAEEYLKIKYPSLSC